MSRRAPVFGAIMYRIGLLVICAVALSGCASSQDRAAKADYINAVNAYNTCLLNNPTALDNCAAQRTVMDNELQVYNAVSGDP